MAPSELEGQNLGEKHRVYNKILKERLSTKEIDSEDDGNDESDIANLIKIDVACHNRNVEFVLNTFKSQDILYVIRAIEKSTWLITDKQYSHIINVAYMQNELFPSMTIKAQLKLLKHIKHHLKDEPRVEEFYKNETNLKLAMKWLPNCSVAFIEANVIKHLDHLQPQIIKRICEKSFSIFKKIVECGSSVRNLFKNTVFLLRSHPNEYFEILMKQTANHEKNYLIQFNRLNAKNTEILMNNFSQQVIANFLQFSRHIDIPTFVKFLRNINIKSYLFEQVNKITTAENQARYRVNFHHILNYETIALFVKRMPKHEQFGFVKDVFIEKNPVGNKESPEIAAKIKLRKEIYDQSYNWYEFAPFDLAFEKLKVIIHQSFFDTKKRYFILNVLTKCLNNNLTHINVLLKYYIAEHIDDPVDKQCEFVENLMLQTNVLKYDRNTWDNLDLIFKNMGVYNTEEDGPCKFTKCVETIVMYNAIKDDIILEVIENKFVFTTFKPLIKLLKEHENRNLFHFLFTYLIQRIETKSVTGKKEFQEVIGLLQNALKLINDYGNDISKFKIICNKIKELGKINSSNSWKINLSCLFNVKKSWRKLFFEESLIIHPSEETIMNALKHDPQLLKRNSPEVEKIRRTYSLLHVNRKLKIYWPQTLADEWTQAYLKNLDTLGDDGKALVRGLCVISPKETITEVIQKYTPKDEKINWSQTNESELNTQRNLAMNMHLARPQIHPDLVLGYAKGDYLKYALPSVLAIFYNLNLSQTHEYIPKLLNAPVSLRKHGVRIAFSKLTIEELKEICTNIWNNAENATIRKVLFEFSFKLLCNKRKDTKIAWEILKSFIDNLSYAEDESVYKLLPEISNIPDSVKIEYFMQVYKFLHKLIQNTVKQNETYVNYKDMMISNAREMMHLFPEEFIIEFIQQLLDEKFFKIKNPYILQTSDYGVITILSSYLLSTKNVKEQTKRYEKLMLPLIKRSCAMWEEPDNSFIRRHLHELVKCLAIDLKEIVFQKDYIVPYKMFVDIQSKFIKGLSKSHNYILLTEWNLLVVFTKIMTNHPKNDSNWGQYSEELAPLYGSAVLQCLKQEVATHFPRIYTIFIKALRELLRWLMDFNLMDIIYISLLEDPKFIPGYLACADLLQLPSNLENRMKLANLYLTHPSIEVRMHFHCVWNTDRLIMSMRS